VLLFSSDPSSLSARYTFFHPHKKKNKWKIQGKYKANKIFMFGSWPIWFSFNIFCVSLSFYLSASGFFFLFGIQQPTFLDVISSYIARNDSFFFIPTGFLIFKTKSRSPWRCIFLLFFSHTHTHTHWDNHEIIFFLCVYWIYIYFPGQPHLKNKQTNRKKKEKGRVPCGRFFYLGAWWKRLSVSCVSHKQTLVSFPYPF